MRIFIKDQIEVNGSTFKGWIEVTKDFGNQLIRQGKARSENFIEKIITKKKK